MSSTVNTEMLENFESQQDKEELLESGRKPDHHDQLNCRSIGKGVRLLKFPVQ
jgi:hypothetical protein